MSVAIDHELMKVCSTADVPIGEGRAVTVDGRRIAVFHTASGWYALDDACPHRSGPLSDGILADSCVACPLHDRRFSLADGAALTEGASVTSHRVFVLDGHVHVAVTHPLERAA